VKIVDGLQIFAQNTPSATPTELGDTSLVYPHDLLAEVPAVQ